MTRRVCTIACYTSTQNTLTYVDTPCDQAVSHRCSLMTKRCSFQTHGNRQQFVGSFHQKKSSIPPSAHRLQLLRGGQVSHHDMSTRARCTWFKHVQEQKRRGKKGTEVSYTWVRGGDFAAVAFSLFRLPPKASTSLVNAVGPEK